MLKTHVLFSGGLDSLAAFCKIRDELVATKQFDAHNPINLHFIFYGQDTAELLYAARLAEYFGTYLRVHYAIDELRNNAAAAMKFRTTTSGVEAFIIPDRNRLMLETLIAHGACDPEHGNDIIFGFGAHDQADFPDCREDMFAAWEEEFDSYNIRIQAPVIGMTKKDILAYLKHEVNVPTALAWTCYCPETLPSGLKVACCKCPACQVRLAAETELAQEGGKRNGN
jgi:7-cyano-7-deazaguanine synthase in queuosine biosynthesis